MVRNGRLLFDMSRKIYANGRPLLTDPTIVEEGQIGAEFAKRKNFIRSPLDLLTHHLRPG